MQSKYQGKFRTVNTVEFLHKLIFVVLVCSFPSCQKNEAKGSLRRVSLKPTSEDVEIIKQQGDENSTLPQRDFDQITN